MLQAFPSDDQWRRIAPLLPKRRSAARPWAEDWYVLEDILWVLKAGAHWRDLASHYPSASTCWRRVRRWEADVFWLDFWRTFLLQRAMQVPRRTPRSLSLGSLIRFSFQRSAGRSPKIALPTRTMVAPSSMAISKSWLMPMLRSGSGAPPSFSSSSRSSRSWMK